MNNWIQDSVFYHIYPLGFCAAPEKNDFSQPPVPRLQRISSWLDHLSSLGVTALYLGPLFQSGSHGYDTADYYHLDRRLGRDEDLAALGKELEERGIRLVLDGVFHHVGRDFWAFRDLLAKREQSQFKDWFEGVRFGTSNALGDPFCYDTWRGHLSLVKLNTSHPEVRDHIFEAVRSWIENFRISGLRLDVADCLDHGFMRALGQFTRSIKDDFLLLGEVIHGDYNQWLKGAALDSVTNYELYKGFFSAHNDRNLFEVAYSLKREFGEGGLYRGAPLYNFLDNHDVDRIASRLAHPAYLYTAAILLFTVPGVPALYYGSEWGIRGEREPHSDAPLRPALNFEEEKARGKDQERVFRNLAQIRKQYPALRRGDIKILHTASEQLVFSRQADHEEIIVALNINEESHVLDLPLAGGGRWHDLLNPGEVFSSAGGRIALPLYPHWGRILIRKEM